MGCRPPKTGPSWGHHVFCAAIRRQHWKFDPSQALAVGCRQGRRGAVGHVDERFIQGFSYVGKVWTDQLSSHQLRTHCEQAVQPGLTDLAQGTDEEILAGRLPRPGKIESYQEKSRLAFDEQVVRVPLVGVSSKRSGQASIRNVIG